MAWAYNWREPSQVVDVGTRGASALRLCPLGSQQLRRGERVQWRDEVFKEGLVKSQRMQLLERRTNGTPCCSLLTPSLIKDSWLPGLTWPSFPLWISVHVCAWSAHMKSQCSLWAEPPCTWVLTALEVKTETLTFEAPLGSCDLVHREFLSEKPPLFLPYTGAG
jgi:hypothetical protein